MCHIHAYIIYSIIYMQYYICLYIYIRNYRIIRLFFDYELAKSLFSLSVFLIELILIWKRKLVTQGFIWSQVHLHNCVAFFLTTTTEMQILGFLNLIIQKSSWCSIGSLKVSLLTFYISTICSVRVNIGVW